MVGADDAYEVIDCHIQAGSPALERGNIAVAPSEDWEGDPRPGYDGLVDIGVDERVSVERRQTLTWAPPSHPTNTYVLDRAGIDEMIAPEVARQEILLELDLLPFMYSALNAHQNAAGSGWWGEEDPHRSFPFEWGQEEINAWRLFTLTPRNVSLAGTSGEALEEIGEQLSSIGMNGGEALLAQALGIWPYSEILSLPSLAGAIVDGVVATHPETPSDGSIQVTLEDALTDIETLGDRYDSSSGIHPGFVVPSSSLPHSQILYESFHASIVATSNLHWHDGVNLGVDRASIAFLADLTGPTFDDPLEYDLLATGALTAHGLAPDPTVDMDLRVFENDAWIAAGDATSPLPEGNGDAWSLDPWELERVVAETAFGEHLGRRDFMEELRSAGVQTGGPSSLSKSDVQTFANALDRFLARRSG